MNLIVWHFIVLYLLSEGSSSKSLWLGYNGSLRMFWAFFKALCTVQFISEGEREQSVIFLAVLECFPLCCSAVEIPHTCSMSTHSQLSSNRMTQAVIVTDGSFWGVSESKFSAVTSWWSLRCAHSTTGPPQSGCPGTWSRRPSPHNLCWSLHHPDSCATSAL